MSESTPTQPAQTTQSEAHGSPVTMAEPQTEEVIIAVETVESEPVTDAGTKRSTCLYRHPEEKLIGGVCGGLGDCFGIDPIFVRIMWVGLTLGTAGAGLFAYAALWLLLPVGTAQAGLHAPAALELNERNVGRAGLLLVLGGGLWLLGNLGILPALWSVFWHVMRLLFWPVLLIGAGVLMLNNRRAWLSRFGGVRASVQNGKTRAAASFSRQSVKDGLRRARSRIPLKRSRDERLIYGVCGSIGRAIGLDANLVRIIWVAFAIGSVGTGVLIYVLIGWLLPEESPVIETTYSSETQEVSVIDGTSG
jgi:phage shock protein PspC (stress-responsive transcriptional regulator)